MQIIPRTISLIALFLISPLLIIVGIGIKLTSRGPILFKQERIGKDGLPFKVFKFRSMYAKEDIKGSMLTVGADPRVTPIGKIIRKLKIDELPQLINVVLGQMAFVGPRPEVKKYVDLYTPEQREVLKRLPGITDDASIKYIDENQLLAASENPEKTYISEIMPEKLRINLDYIANRTLFSDLIVILKTILKIIVRK